MLSPEINGSDRQGLQGMVRRPVACRGGGLLGDCVGKPMIKRTALSRVVAFRSVLGKEGG
jgi:hypothetical protein